VVPLSKFSEQDICRIYITPAIEKAGWDLKRQVREQVSFTAGKIHVRGNQYKRGERKRADYILYYKRDIPIAVIEAKDGSHSIGAGMQQGLNYAKILDIPFVYSSNGDGFVEHDPTAAQGKIENNIDNDEFPTPEELWRRYKIHRGIESPEKERIYSQEYFSDPKGKSPRYYQTIAINRSIKAIIDGSNRVLLTMATGTGKTYTAFQIIHRLWKAGVKKRILFLADRNILIDQTKQGDFKHFRDKMTMVKKHNIDKSYEIYLALYQGLTNYNDDKDAYKEFSRDFFDLVVVDECHRGSAANDSAWREILDYFDSATHIGLTATPRETKEVSNIDYFGEPIYTYSLKQGIDDGFLAPYKVIRVGIDIDSEGWRPEIGKKDRAGKEVEDRIYNIRDYDRTLVIDERTELVAARIAEYLRGTNPFDKTIVFCVDIDHAQRIRQALINELSEYALANDKYVMKITGDDKEGKLELDNFINPEERYPVIATTSKLLSTGVDAQTCKLIVLDSNINSMTEFKQIIGRGTRIREDFGKAFFTIMDFRQATNLFADPGFDGPAIQIYEPKLGDPVVPPEDDGNIIKDQGPGTTGGYIVPDISFEENSKKEKRKKVYVKGVEVEINQEQVQYLNEKGHLITLSVKKYSRKKALKNYRTLDDFLQKWNEADKIQTIVDELENEGVMIHELMDTVGKEYDPFDLVCHVAYDMPPLTRKERANNVKKRHYFAKYGEQARNVLETLLDKYADAGIENIESPKILEISPLNKLGTPTEIISVFGGVKEYQDAIHELRLQLYKSE